MEQKIPEQKEGGYSDTVSKITFDMSAKAEKFFEVVKKRFLDVNSWELVAGKEKAEFSLRNASGEVLYTEPKVGDFFKIKIPGPRNLTGDGYDWVKVEETEHKKAGNEEMVYIRVRPTSDPTKPGDKTAHFFDDKATSNFIIKREAETIFAEVHGRNEEPNTEDLSALEKIRNFFVAVGGIIAGSKFQWKSLTDGLLKNG